MLPRPMLYRTPWTIKPFIKLVVQSIIGHHVSILLHDLELLSSSSEFSNSSSDLSESVIRIVWPHPVGKPLWHFRHSQEKHRPLPIDLCLIPMTASPPHDPDFPPHDLFYFILIVLRPQTVRFFIIPPYPITSDHFPLTAVPFPWPVPFSWPPSPSPWPAVPPLWHAVICKLNVLL